jgi:RNA polymerase-binding transcription factor DksA
MPAEQAPGYRPSYGTDLSDLRERLLARRHAIIARVARADDALGQLDAEHPAEFEEEAQDRNQARLVARLTQHGRAEIEAIDLAIARMERGEYGSCEGCEEPIDVERLEVLPTARLCTTCAETNERRARLRAQSTADDEEDDE